MNHYTTSLINRIGDIEGELAEAHKKCESAKTSEAKAKSRAKAAKARVACLKKVLKEVNADLASEKER